MTTHPLPYVGPPELLYLLHPAAEGTAIRSPADLDAWLASRPAAELAEPFTHVVDLTGRLRLAARRSEHVVCAGGAPVLCAGEITFARRPEGSWAVEEVTNQSTGYCPDPATAWPPLTAALDRAGITHPPDFTHAFVFRRCPACRELNVVREGELFCALCGTPLPTEWNVSYRADH
ncbi:hypothetical protein ACWCYY_06950 [Kitasatospora sp. NPDC001664]